MAETFNFGQNPTGCSSKSHYETSDGFSQAATHEFVGFKRFELNLINSAIHPETPDVQYTTGQNIMPLLPTRYIQDKTVASRQDYNVSSLQPH